MNAPPHEVLRLVQTASIETLTSSNGITHQPWNKRNQATPRDV